MPDPTTSTSTSTQPHQSQSQNQQPQHDRDKDPNQASHSLSQSPPEDQQKKEALAAFTATLHSVGTNLEAPLRDRAATLQSNDAALERQEAELVDHTQRLAKQNAQWEGIAEETRRGLKEIGDVQNWAEMIERDLLVLEDMMESVERDEGGASEYGGDAEGHVNGNGGAEAGTGADADGNANGKKSDATSKGWLRWW
ncbi:uncharacterized protein N7459_004193 [Penicillium hispanicum]|uniref:uncharacterized protein n=1 Tax=Penicillium hispanicum TaxID=1080232 RepID=UPI00254000BC|nr:uncharacterized protein N7459_004193 [Penicillium hispanicum]KAJ5584393.1 hypothetical protein N7459_004193 [Penicillium hispanicum]